MKTIKIKFDGGFMNANGKNIGSFGYVISLESKRVVGKGKFEHPKMTVNVAEYLGLLKAVKRVKTDIISHKLNPKDFELDIYGDSLLVIETTSKRWGYTKNKEQWKPHSKSPALFSMLSKVLGELEAFAGYKLTWVNRENNRTADQLTRLARRELPKNEKFAAKVVKRNTKKITKLAAQMA